MGSRKSLLCIDSLLTWDLTHSGDNSNMIDVVTVPETVNGELVEYTKIAN